MLSCSVTILGTGNGNEMENRNAYGDPRLLMQVLCHVGKSGHKFLSKGTFPFIDSFLLG